MLRTARARTKGRVIAVVQPHRYTRLASLFDEFCTCFHDADTVLVAPVYAAGEAPIEGASRDALVEGVRRRGHRDVRADRRAGRSGAPDRGLRPAGRSRRLPGCRQHHPMGQRAAGPAGGAGEGGGRGMSAWRETPARSCAARLRRDVPLAPLTWLRVGGPAEAVFQPADADDLAAFLRRPAGRACRCCRWASPRTCSCATAASTGVVVRFGGPLAKVDGRGRAGPRRRRRARPARGAGGAARRARRARVPDRHPRHGRRCRAHERRRLRRRDQGPAALGRGAGPAAASLHRLANAELGFAYRRSALPRGLDRGPRRLPGRAGRARGDPRPDERDPRRARGGAAAAGRHRRQHLQEPAGPQGLAADRRRRLPRPAPGCGHGLGEALQLPDQHRRRQRRRGRAPGRAGAPARARAQRRRARVGGHPDRPARRAWSWRHDAGTSPC